MTGDLDPERAADLALDRGGDAGDVDDAGDEDGSSSRTSTNTDESTVSRFARSLLDGRAEGPKLGELQREYDLERPEGLMLRGTLRAAGADGMPPIGEIVLGGLLRFRDTSGSSSDAGDGDDGNLPVVADA